MACKCCNCSVTHTQMRHMILFPAGLTLLKFFVGHAKLDFDKCYQIYVNSGVFRLISALGQGAYTVKKGDL